MEISEIQQEIRQNIQKGYEEFVKAYFPMISGMIASRVYDVNARQDLEQEFFIKIMQNKIIEKFKGTTEIQFKAFLSKIILHFIFDYFRTSKKENERYVTTDFVLFSETGSLVSKDDPLAELLHKETMKQMQEAIAKLPLDHRIVINLRLLGYSNIEISEILEKPKGTIDSWSARAQQTLRDELKNLQANLTGGGL